MARRRRRCVLAMLAMLSPVLSRWPHVGNVGYVVTRFKAVSFCKVGYFVGYCVGTMLATLKHAANPHGAYVSGVCWQCCHFFSRASALPPAYTTYSTIVLHKNLIYLITFLMTT